MLSVPFSDWWCCLNPRERNMVSALIVEWLTNDEFITLESYTILAFTFGLAALTEVNAYFIIHYGLTEGIWIDPDNNPVQVLYFDSTLWPSFYAFSLTDDFVCLEPCELLTFSA